MDENNNEETVEHLRCHINKTENIFWSFNKIFFNLFVVVVIVKQVNT